MNMKKVNEDLTRKNFNEEDLPNNSRNFLKEAVYSKDLEIGNLKEMVKKSIQNLNDQKVIKQKRKEEYEELNKALKNWSNPVNILDE